MPEGPDGTAAPPAPPAVADDAPTGDLGITVALDQFSGPMDLLLYLVRKAEVDVKDLPITAIADQFAAWVSAAAGTVLDLEAAGDFVVMAATLLEIKARLVAPPPEGTVVHDDGEDAFDPRAGLIRKLLVYRAAKEAAFDLDRRDDERRRRHERGHREVVPDDPAEVDAWELKDVGVGSLANLWFDLLKRLDNLGPRTVIVDDVPMGVRMAQVVEGMRTRGEGRLSELFALDSGPVARVGIVMAVLEGTRQRMLRVRQGEQYGDVTITFRPEDDRAVAQGDPGPPEQLPKRQRRPPLVTWSGSVAAEDAGEDGPEDDTPTVENEEQRFLRELETNIGVERLLHRAGDLERGFIDWWEETHPGEPLPPGVVKPEPPPPPPPPPPVAEAKPDEPAKPKRQPPRPKAQAAAAPAEAKPPETAATAPATAAPEIPVPPLPEPGSTAPVAPFPDPLLPVAAALPVAHAVAPPMPPAVADAVAPPMPLPAEPASPSFIVVPLAAAVPAPEPAAAVAPPQPEAAVAEPIVADEAPANVAEPEAVALPAAAEPVAAAVAEPAPEPVAAEVAPGPVAAEPDVVAEAKPDAVTPAAEPEPIADPVVAEPAVVAEAALPAVEPEPIPEPVASEPTTAVEPEPIADPVAPEPITAVGPGPIAEPVAPEPIAAVVEPAVEPEPIVEPVAAEPAAEIEPAAVVAAVAPAVEPAPAAEPAAPEPVAVEPAPVSEAVTAPVTAAVQPVIDPPAPAVVPAAAVVAEAPPPIQPDPPPPLAVAAPPGPPPDPRPTANTAPTPAPTTPKTSPTTPMPLPRHIKLAALAALWVVCTVALVAWMHRPSGVLEVSGPAAGATVARDGEIVWSLNLPLDEADRAHAALPSIEPAVPGAFAWRDARTCVFTPAGALPADARLTVRFDGRLRAKGGFRFDGDALPVSTLATLPALQAGAASATLPAFGDGVVEIALNRAPADTAALFAAVAVSPAVPLRKEVVDGRLRLTGPFAARTSYRITLADTVPGRADDRPAAWQQDLAMPARQPGARLLAGVGRQPRLEAVGLELVVVEGADGRRDIVRFPAAADGTALAELPAWLLQAGENRLRLRWDGGEAEAVIYRHDLRLEPRDAVPALLGGTLPVTASR